jgi:hypothetical protein
MTFDEIKKAVLDNWWCEGSPLAWTTENPGVGLAHMALEGQVGTFNLCWLMLQRKEPPPLQVYHGTNMRWVIMLSGGVYIEGRSLLHHAAMRSLRDFSQLILPHTHNRIDYPGGVPWAMLGRIAQGVLA